MEEVELREVAHKPGNMLNHVESSVNMAQQEFGIHCISIRIAEHSTLIVILAVVLLVRRNITSNLVLGTLASKTEMPIEMM